MKRRRVALAGLLGLLAVLTACNPVQVSVKISKGMTPISQHHSFTYTGNGPALVVINGAQGPANITGNVVVEGSIVDRWCLTTGGVLVTCKANMTSRNVSSYNHPLTQYNGQPSGPQPYIYVFPGEQFTAYIWSGDPGTTTDSYPVTVAVQDANGSLMPGGNLSALD